MRPLILALALLAACDCPADYPLLDLPCDPLAPACGSGVCAVQDAPELVWACEPGPGSPAGEPCERHQDCGSGWCGPESLGGVCLEGCDTLAPGCADPEATCVGLGGGQYGVCLVGLL